MTSNTNLSPSMASKAAPPAAGKIPSVLLIYAYPSATDGHGAQMLSTAQKVLDEAGATYTVLDLYRSGFQPVMPQSEVEHYGKNVPPDVAAAQAQLSSADVWIFLYPVWWSTPPALFKGYIDRVFTPGFAFQYSGAGSTPLLTNKRALIARTYGSSALQEQKIGNVAYGFMEKAVLEFCGVKSVSVDLYSIDSLPATAFNHALFQLSGAVRRQLVTPTAVPHGLRTVSAPYLPPIERREGPSLKEEDEKPELSAEAQSDLEFFRNARKAAKEKIIGAPSGGRNRGERGRGDQGRSERSGGQFSGRARSDDSSRGGRFQGRDNQRRTHGPSFGGGRSNPPRPAPSGGAGMRGNISYSGRGAEGGYGQRPAGPQNRNQGRPFGGQGNRPPGGRPPPGGNRGSQGQGQRFGEGSHKQRHRGGRHR